MGNPPTPNGQYYENQEYGKGNFKGTIKKGLESVKVQQFAD